MEKDQRFGIAMGAPNYRWKFQRPYHHPVGGRLVRGGAPNGGQAGGGGRWDGQLVTSA